MTLYKDAGKKQKQIAKLCKVSQSAVSKILKQFRLTRSLETNLTGHCGRKRKTTKRSDRLLLMKSKKNPRLTSQDLCRDLRQHGVKVSSRTVRRRLCELKRPARCPVKRQLLNARMKRSRLEWAKIHQHWTVEDWKKVCFTLLFLFNKFQNLEQFLN